jgi:hypothetical protein
MIRGKGSDTGILAAMQSFLIVDGSMRRIDIAHIQDGIDGTSHTRNKDGLGQFAIEILVAFNVHNLAFPNVTIPQHTIVKALYLQNNNKEKSTISISHRTPQWQPGVGSNICVGNMLQYNIEIVQPQQQSKRTLRMLIKSSKQKRHGNFGKMNHIGFLETHSGIDPHGGIHSQGTGSHVHTALLTILLFRCCLTSTIRSICQTFLTILFSSYVSTEYRVCSDCCYGQSHSLAVTAAGE